MMTFPNIDPVIFSLGPFHIRWYGLMYIIGFAASYFLVRYQIKKFNFTKMEEHFENANLVLILSVIVGGRLGYVLFYNFSHYLQHPLEIFATWTGGMSFHGACLALILSGAWFARRHGINFWQGADLYVATIPIGLGLGRIGNFINGELYGRLADVPWAMVFPYGGPLPRHPSQLYEAFLEGVCLFTILWLCKDRPWQKRAGWPHGAILSLFLICYGVFRIFVEQFREPDPHLGFLYGSLTMGQLLSGVMIAGGTLIWFARQRKSGRAQKNSAR